MNNTDTKIFIRKSNLKDVPGIMETEELSYPTHHWSSDSFKKELVNKLAHYRSAFNSDKKLVGYCGFWQILEEAHITTLAVHPEYRRQKIGETLLTDAVNECYKLMIKYITLEVRESNIPALSLYEKFGFSVIGMRKNYYQDNHEHALIMFTENIWYDKFKLNFEKIKKE